GRDRRILRDRQGENSQPTGQHDDDCQNPGKDRTVDEKVCHVRAPYGLVSCGAGARWPASGWVLPGPLVADGVVGWTGMPGWIFCSPSTITRSPAARPSSTSHWSPTVRLTWT